MTEKIFLVAGPLWRPLPPTTLSPKVEMLDLPLSLDLTSLRSISTYRPIVTTYRPILIIDKKTWKKIF